MPHINRIRVNNVKYNFGTQFYDDFIMRMSGRNTIYDLANGGGKSVLMLLLLQNLIPNCTLDEKQPIEKLFREGTGSTTIHSLIEWRLNDCDVKNNMKYMTTGFCARRAKKEETEGEEENRETAAIEYFNYCIFYREANENDIKNLPLRNGRERITYHGLKSYLRGLEKKDYQLEVKLFDRKGDYQRFIAQYGLYESEWEIIRGINKTEGHVRTYFETNYRTTRKVVEDLFIEEIIQKSFLNKTASSKEEDSMAETLLQIKDKLLELAKKKGDMDNYDRQVEVLGSFIQQIRSLKAAYAKKELLEKQLVQVYHTQKQEEQNLTVQRLAAANRRQEFRKNQEEQRRQLETAGVQKENGQAKALEQELFELEEQTAAVEVELEQQRRSLKERETGNHYLDYRSNRSRAESLKETIAHFMTDKGELTEELQKLVGQIYELGTTEVEYQKAELETLEGYGKAEQERILELEERERIADREIAILKRRQQEQEEKELSLSAEVRRLRTEQELLLGDEASDMLAKQQRNCKELEVQFQNLRKEEERVQQLLAEEKLTLREKQLEAKALEWELARQGEILTEGREQEPRVEAIRESLALQKTQEILPKLLEIEASISYRIYQIRAELETGNQKKQQLASGQFVTMSETVKKRKDYLERCHGLQVQTGDEYLTRLDEFSRQMVLERLPVLPYALIVMGEYRKLQADEELGVEDCLEEPVWIVNGEALLARENTITGADLSIATRTGMLYLDSEAVRVQQTSLQERLRNLENEYSHLEQKRQQLGEDKRFIEYFLREYFDTEQENWAKYEELRLESETLRTRMEFHQKKQEEMDQQLQQICQRKTGLQIELEIENQKLAELSHLVKISCEADQAQKEMEEARVQSLLLERQHKDMKAHLTASRLRQKTRENRSTAIRRSLLEWTQEWKESHAPFYMEKQGKTVISAEKYSEEERQKRRQDLEKARGRFRGLHDALQREFSGLEDKQKLLASYEQAMRKAQQAIEYNGATLVRLEQLYQENRLTATSQEELIQLKATVDASLLRHKHLLRKQVDAKEKKNRLEGSVSRSIQTIIEKYGFYEEVEGHDEQLEEFIQEKKRILAEEKQQAQDFDQQLTALEKKEQAVILIQKELERMAQSGELNLNTAAELLPIGMDVSAFYEETSKEYSRILKSIYGKREDFGREKLKLADALEQLGAYALAHELRVKVEIPTTRENAELLAQGMKDTIACIELEKERISRGVEDMQRIKENFESQCLQTCENMKLELERLSGLSTIQMEGQTISVIQLQIPYVKEEFCKARMEQYVEELVNHADEFETAGERLKYIRNGLSWKRLFSVIVTDMNLIRLNLYKRERMKEQSRYLRYEEAVGSTGQSQGIYIQFLIGVINYISSINSGKTEGNGLRKVIFIDNPFGAAKDIYIWEPIFKLLKTNNVQLIVPARGATPAITGRFDVNYVLGQKLTDGKQQTVVVDYFSRVKQEELEYTRLSYEQQRLF